MKRLTEISSNGEIYEVGSVIFYPYVLKKNKYISKTTGKEVDYTAAGAPYTASSWIPIYSKVILIKSSNGGDDGGIAFYDKDGRFIKGMDGYSSWSGPQEIAITVPAKAVYMRFTQMIGYESQTYVKGVVDGDEIFGNVGCPFAHIKWVKDSAYATSGTGELLGNISGAIASNMLVLKAAEKYLMNWRDDVGNYYYKNLFDVDRNFVGTKRDNETYYDISGNQVVSPIDYYSFSMSVALPYSRYTVPDVYINTGTVYHTKISVNNIPDLETALIEAGCNANPCHIYDIELAAGTYDVWAGIDKTKLDNTGDQAWRRGLEIPNFCNLTGLGYCRLNLNLPEDQRQYENVVSVLNLIGCESKIKNLIIIGSNLRYPVHDDGVELNAGRTTIWENCWFQHKGRTDTTKNPTAYCYGAGSYIDQKTIFRNCVFIGKEPSLEGEWVGYFTHNHQGATAPHYAEFEHCAFLGDGPGIDANEFYSYDNAYTISVTGCKFNENTTIRMRGACGGRLLGGGNSEMTIENTAQSSIFMAT